MIVSIDETKYVHKRECNLLYDFCHTLVPDKIPLDAMLEYEYKLRVQESATYTTKDERTLSVSLNFRDEAKALCKILHKYQIPKQQLVKYAKYTDYVEDYNVDVDRFLRKIIGTTSYFLAKDNAYNGIIATDGFDAYWLPVDSNGTDKTTGVNLYDGEKDVIVEKIKTVLSNMINSKTLYDIKDIIQDYPDEVFEFDERAYDSLVKVAEFHKDSEKVLKANKSSGKRVKR